MKRIATALLIAGAAFALSGCPSNTVKEGAAVAGGDASGDATGNVSATAAQCNAERSMVEQSVETYTILEGATPVSEAAMVPDYLRIESPYMDIDAAGNVIAAPGGGCE